ncbi:SigB/SigF/SigG family RNA polymerase sigma factor [Olsenella sp. AF16-14LB]|jgi:RNA polymerase sigma-B factor|uniref:SigB/SigF/SigG family RNA polymerase sigma factor n=1 Tax=Atopobiaceae TaxID=1643824 RepID=UPI000E48E96D|nr:MULTISPECIES: SigB/SigF/SigG family RNA polymerase sigma factor [unclassified Olsenella]RGS50466.1 SigB/SigF/SigG family RNA polymerase sigma factor [Olsenella sp. AF21-51]RGU50536.1 SigB/SigF/SigG family RNA polymerase sigma factor [Olsenella sp. AF16-14LB]RGU81993.1 SigB/SigF/SigG family RNA polymerase sigma factor [Olsenella sp. AF15-43LB]RHB57471.1 SigB/SigF/SigG family RNA polymerase sigma factor [Olsenella sp. AM39-30AC]RHD76020.1 SigB/SigF/SigG family RNA polymerase sigma factor [Ols
MPSASTTNAQETANTPNVATQETEEARTAREASEARAERARHRSLHRTPKGKAAWDKDRTRELFRQYKATGDPEVRDQLIVSHLNLVRFLASKFKNRGEPLDDLIQVGTIGLIKAIDRFDPSRGLEFTTYATPTILGEIKRHFRDKGWSVRVPRRLQELSAKVNQANDELTNELSRSPSVEEIAKRVGASVDDVLEAMESSSAYSSVPLEGGGSSDDDDAPSVIDHYATEDENLAASDDRIVLEDAIRDFSPREKDVIRMRFFEGMTQVEIAERLGISQVQVSRLLRRTLRRVQDKIDPEGLMSK